MAIPPNELVGYQKAQFAKASQWRLILLFVQFLVTIPAALSVIVKDETWLYILAVVGPLLLVAWWVARAFYRSSRDAAHAARRAGLITNGLGMPISPEEHQRLRQMFTVSQADAVRLIDPQYFATVEHPGTARLGEMLEESAFYSKDVHRVSGNVMLAVFLIFIAIAIAAALFSVPYADRVTAITGIKLVLAGAVFLLSSDVLGSVAEHREACRMAADVQRRMGAAYSRSFPEGDVLLAMVDYNNAMEGAPEAVPGVFRGIERGLNERWTEYKVDRDLARATSSMGGRP